MYHTPSAVNVFSYAAPESRVRGVQVTGHLSVFFGTNAIAKPLQLGKKAPYIDPTTSPLAVGTAPAYAHLLRATAP